MPADEPPSPWFLLMIEACDRNRPALKIDCRFDIVGKLTFESLLT
jgi:hypothetical protein